VAYESSSPETAQTVVARFVELYLGEHARVNRVSGVHEFLAQQTAELKKKLDCSQVELRALKSRTGVSAPEAQRTLLVNRRSHLEDDLAAKLAAIEATTARIQQCRQMIATEPKAEVLTRTSGVGNQGTDFIRQQFYGVKLQEAAAATKYTEDHPLYQQARKQAAAAEEILDRQAPSREEIKTGPSRTVEQAQGTLGLDEPLLAGLKVEVAALQKQLAQSADDLAKFHEDEIRVADLQREVDLQVSAYRRYSESLEQMRIDEALAEQRISNISVAQPATWDPQPVRPKGWLNLLAGLAFALAGSLGLVWWADQSDPTFRSAADVERRLGVPVLLTVPRWSGPPGRTAARS
jgi:uncharacterized protein involved in exopolysaccharide biosynthesis